MKDKQIKFRCSQEEYDLLDKEREECGMNMSSFIRARVFHEGNRIIRNPELIAVIREANEGINRICVAVNHFMAGSDSQYEIEELKKHLVLVEHLETRIIDIISEELEHGDYKTAPP